MDKPTKGAEDGLKKVILYLKGTPEYGLLLPYDIPGNSKRNEIYQDHNNLNSEQKVEIFTDSDWAGNKSGPTRRRHSVSSVVIYV